MKFRKALVFQIISFFLVLSGCARPVNRAVERQIRRALPDLLGSAKVYHVHVDGAPGRTISGRLSHVLIEGEDIQPVGGGPLIDQLTLNMHGVVFDTKSHQLRKMESANFKAVFGQDSLNLYLVGETADNPDLTDIRLKFGSGNLVSLMGKRVTLGVGVPFQITGPLRITGAMRLELDPKHLSIIGIALPDRLTYFLKSHLEQAIDLSRIDLPIRVTAISAEPGKLILTGDVDMSKLQEWERRPL